MVVCLLGATHKIEAQKKSAATPSAESIVNAYFRYRVTSQSGGDLLPTGFRKTNGYEQGFGLYVIEWQAEILFQQDGYKAGDMFVGYWQNFSVLHQKPGTLDSLIVGNTIPFKKGTTVRLTGTATLRKTEKGPRLEGFEVKTSQVLAKVAPPPKPISKSDVRAPLISLGFEFKNGDEPMVSIKGLSGPCQVQAFVTAAPGQDPRSYLDRATYVGNCVDGFLEGVSLVITDRATVANRQAFMSYFSKGRIAYPILDSFLDIDELNFGVEEMVVSYGCVYFGKWDKSDTRVGCQKIKKFYGEDILSESNARDLRNGSFNLAKYQANFKRFMSRMSPKNKPEIQKTK